MQGLRESQPDSIVQLGFGRGLRELVDLDDEELQKLRVDGVIGNEAG